MALAPNLKQKRGLFGSVGQMPQQPPMTSVEQPMAAKPKFFGEGGVGRGIAGNIGDFLLQYAGMNPIYQPAMQQRQNMAYDQQQRQTQRRDRLEDWQAQEQWKRDNPAPKPPTSFEQILDAAGIGGEERIGLLRRKAENDAAGVPVGIDVQNPDGSVTRQYVRPGTLGGSSSGPAVGAVEDGYRFRGGNPADKNNWEPVSGPPPISEAPGRPNQVARSAYQAWVNQMGQAEADAMMRRNGLTVGNY